MRIKNILVSLCVNLATSISPGGLAVARGIFPAGGVQAEAVAGGRRGSPEAGVGPAQGLVHPEKVKGKCDLPC